MIEQKDYSKQYVASCFDSRFIRNRTTRQPLLVPCGKCPACLNRKTTSMASRLNIEARNHKYTFFITLSYANEYAPRVLVDGEFGNPTLTFHPQVKLSNSGEFIPAGPEDECYDVFGDGPNDLGLTTDDYLKLLSKSENDKYPFTYVEKTHLQKFIKRLRFNSMRRYGATLRYYAVSEYGPKSLRAHYHVLVFTDNKDLAIDLIGFWNTQLELDEKGLNIEDLPANSVLSSSWKYGRVGCELVQKSASSYVAGYVASSSRLPLVYKKCPRLRPFALYSRCPAIGVPFPSKGEIQRCYDTISIGEVVARGSSFTRVYPALQTICNYFPRVSGYNSLGRNVIDKRYSVYALIEHARKYYGLASMRRYFDRLKTDLKYQNDDQILRDYYISKRMYKYASLMGVTPRYYVEHYIRRAWSIYELRVLSEKYSYQEDQFKYLSPVERINSNRSLVAAIGNTDMHVNMYNLIKSYGINPNSLPDLSLKNEKGYKAYVSRQTEQYLECDKLKEINSILNPEIL